jgi:hypothetical protein
MRWQALALIVAGFAFGSELVLKGSTPFVDRTLDFALALLGLSLITSILNKIRKPRDPRN